MSLMTGRGPRWVWVAPIAIVLLSWGVFCAVAARAYYEDGSRWASAAFVLAGTLPLVLSARAVNTRGRWWPRLQRWLEASAAQVDALPDRWLPLWIALAAGLALYAELVIIRYHGSCFAIYGFFKNVSLLSCFLGLGIGYALGGAKALAHGLVLPMLAIQLVTLHVLRFTEISVDLQNPVSEQLAMGLITASQVLDALPTYAFMIWSFSFNAMCLIPLGQLAARLMGRSSKLAGYGWNLLGSIAGIVLFWGISFLWTPPVVWFALVPLALAVFLRRSLASVIVFGTVIVATLSVSPPVDRYDVYSPYQILTVYPNDNGVRTVMVNHFSYQSVRDYRHSPQDAELRKEEKYYQAPYEVSKKPQNVLVVGSGTGNDVAAALRNGAGHVDAVEIDPAVLALGRGLHPERPYQSRRVTAHVQDARAFMRYTQQRYDLIVYGLLDAHTALSGLSGVRLDSFVYTVEALKEARARLKDDGVLCLSFAVIHDRLGLKLYRMIKEAFGRGPTAFVTESDAYVFVIGNDPRTPISVPRDAVDKTARYAVREQLASPSTDDWPFLYMPERRYPMSYLALVAVLLIVSVAFILPAVGTGGGGGAKADVSLTTFLLGAGFMLLETKAITELALHYGSTWVVISIVIVAILIMAFFANVAVMRWPNIPRAVSYVLLLVSLAASLWFSGRAESMNAQWLTRILATAMITLPLFFSGLIFSQELAAAKSVAGALGSNLIGAMLGGCLEYNSMYFGYRSLYVLAMVIYGLSMIVSLTSGLRGRPNKLRGEPEPVAALEAS